MSGLSLMRRAFTVGTKGPIVLVGYTFAESVSTTNITINKPAGTVQGDLMFLLCSAIAGSTWTGPSGWASNPNGAGWRDAQNYYKVAGASEPASYTASIDVAADSRLICVVVRNAAIDVLGGVADVNASTVTAPSVTVSQPASLLLGFFGNLAYTPPMSVPAAMTLLATTPATNPPRSSWTVCTQSVGIGATGGRTSSCTSGNYTAGYLITLKPA